MLAVLVCLVAVHSGLAQSPPPSDAPRLTPPTWFPETSLEGSFAERSAKCEELSESNKEAASQGPIFILETSNADICINFPPRTLEDGKELKGGWRHDRGTKGACSNGCCEFRPPTKNIPEPVDHPEWFETSSDCSSPQQTNKSPLLFQGKNEDPKNVCVKTEDGFRLDEGKLNNCGGTCCIFYKKE